LKKALTLLLFTRRDRREARALSAFSDYECIYLPLWLNIVWGHAAKAGEHLAAAHTQISGRSGSEEEIAPMRALLREAEALITPRK
jgi:hypothetical protein